MNKVFLYAVICLLVISAVPAVSAGDFPWCAMVPCNNSDCPEGPCGPTVTTPTLKEDMIYRIVTSKVCCLSHDEEQGDYVYADAQYYTEFSCKDGNYNADIWWNWVSWSKPDSHSFLQINEQDVNWGPFSNGDSGHSYAITMKGCGEPLSFRVYDWYDEDISNNYCHQRVCICECPAPHTIGYYKKASHWPDGVTCIPIENRCLSQRQAISILKNANAKEMQDMLAAQWIAAKLNTMNGVCAPDSVNRALNAAEDFLALYWGESLTKEQRHFAESLKDILDEFNNGNLY